MKDETGILTVVATVVVATVVATVVVLTVLVVYSGGGGNDVSSGSCVGAMLLCEMANELSSVSFSLLSCVEE